MAGELESAVAMTAEAPQRRMAARPSGERQATSAGPGMGMIRGSVTQAHSVSAAQASGVEALTASVKNIVRQAYVAGARARRQVGGEQRVPTPAHAVKLERLHLLVRGLAGRPPRVDRAQGRDPTRHLGLRQPDPALVAYRLRALT